MQNKWTRIIAVVLTLVWARLQFAARAQKPIDDLAHTTELCYTRTMDGRDYYIKKIVLPSGKTVEIVYFENARPRVDLTICPACQGGLVYPVSWREDDGYKWWMELRCPDCEHVYEGVYDHDVAEQFDQALNRGTDRVIGDLETLQRANLAEYADRFVRALEVDALLPEDF